MSTTSTPLFRWSASGKVSEFVRVMFGCYILVAVGLTAVQMVVAYRAASQRLQDDVAALQRTFSPGIEDAMWRYNAEVLRGILAGMKEIPAVVGVEIVANWMFSPRTPV